MAGPREIQVMRQLLGQQPRQAALTALANKTPLNVQHHAIQVHTEASQSCDCCCCCCWLLAAPPAWRMQRATCWAHAA